MTSSVCTFQVNSYYQGQLEKFTVVSTSVGTAYQFWTFGASNGADYYD